MGMRRRFTKLLREDPNRQKLFPVVLTPEEHEYLIRAARAYNVMASMLVRSRTFFRGWRRELDELRAAQGNEPIEKWDARRSWRGRKKAHELDMPNQGTPEADSRRNGAGAGLPEGREASDR
jgi:hypothetical protein